LQSIWKLLYGNHVRGVDMKIYTQIEDKEVGALSKVGAADRRWTANAGDIPPGTATASATVPDTQVDLIRSRQAREDGGWSKEVCLFPGTELADIEAA
jgi:succinylarginine dihydrolase